MKQGPANIKLKCGWHVNGSLIHDNNINQKRGKRSSNKIPILCSTLLALQPRSPPCQFLDTSFTRAAAPPECIFKLPLRAPRSEIIMFNNSIIDGTFVSSTLLHSLASPPARTFTYHPQERNRMRKTTSMMMWMEDNIYFHVSTNKSNNMDDSAINVHKYVWLSVYLWPALVQTSSNGMWYIYDGKCELIKSITKDMGPYNLEIGWGETIQFAHKNGRNWTKQDQRKIYSHLRWD